MPDKSNA